jgi:flagellar hook-basal body complex protein FliE
MNVAPLQAIKTPLSSGVQAGQQPAETSFANVLQQAVGTVNDLQAHAETAARDFVVGRAQSVHDTMIAMEKADVSLRLLTQMRNKAVEAYQEIMRMQI